jgi:lysophospholipase L1-like esterase
MSRHSWFMRILAGTLLISFGANLFLAWQIRQLYGNHLLSKTFPAKLPITPAIRGETNHFKATVLMVGDSRMAAWKISPPPGIRLVNAGVDGATTGLLRIWLRPLLEEFQPDVVVIQVGINDLKLVGIQPKLMPVLVAQAATNLQEICRDCLAHPSKVILLQIWPTGPPEWLRLPVWNGQVADSVNDLNALLTDQKLISPDVCVVDLLAESGRRPVPADYLDALHFRPEFYQQLTPALLHRLQKLYGHE